MNLRQNNKIWNHVKIFPICEMDTGDNLDIWADKIWTYLETSDDFKRHAIHVKKGLGNKKYTITVLSDKDYCYLISVIRTEFNTDETLVYINTNTPDNITDFVHIAKFIHRDIAAMMVDYKDQILEARDFIKEHGYKKELS